MKSVLKIMAALSVFVGLNAVADMGGSSYLDSRALWNCGGRVELREAGNGDISVRLEDVNLYRCNRLTFTDASSGRVIRTYELPSSTSTFTLSNQMREELSYDRRLNFRISGSSYGYYSSVTEDSFDIVINRWTSYVPVYPVYPTYRPPTYVPNYGNGGSSYRPTPNYGHGGTYYEKSNKGNCKIMQNGQFTGNFAPSYKCN